MPKTEEGKKSDLVAKAKHQLAAVTEEFQHGLARVKDTGERRKLAAAYVDAVQSYLGKAQVGLARYRTKLQVQENAEQPGQPPQAPAAEPADRASTGDGQHEVHKP